MVAGIESAVDVAAGGMHTAVLDSNGKVALLKWDFSLKMNWVFRFGLLAATTKDPWAGQLRRRKRAFCLGRS